MEVISADQGEVLPNSPPLSVDDSTFASAYNQAFYGSAGASNDTLVWMMYAVSLGYILLFLSFGISFCIRPRHTGFVVFTDVDVEANNLGDTKSGPVSELHKVWRRSFITKVYTLLVLQLALTIAIAFSMMRFGGVQLLYWARSNGWWSNWASLLGLFGLLFALLRFKEQHPHNLVLLFLFTACMSWTIGLTCTVYAASGMGVLVVEALAITAVVFIGLTLVVMYSKVDFSFLGTVLPVSLLILIVWGLFAFLLFPSFVFRQVYALAGCLIFAGYILYDTDAITKSLSYDQHVLGAVNLYLDFVNFFLMMLTLLSGGQRSE